MAQKNNRRAKIVGTDIEVDITEKKESSVAYFKKIILQTPQELKNHKEYLKNNLKKNFY